MTEIVDHNLELIDSGLLLPGLDDIPETDPRNIPGDQGDAGAENVDPDALELVASHSLSKHQRHSARVNILHGARLMLAHPGPVHYSQESNRWEGIDHRLRVVRHEYPHHSDCSSAATWLVWNALTHAVETFSVPDFVNGTHWRAGFTGTMVRHGKHLARPHLIGDCLFYGRPPNYDHVTVYIGNGYVFSHGSEPGPFKLRWNYRPDYKLARRYILA